MARSRPEIIEVIFTEGPKQGARAQLSPVLGSTAPLGVIWWHLCADSAPQGSHLQPSPALLQFKRWHKKSPGGEKRCRAPLTHCPPQQHPLSPHSGTNSDRIKPQTAQQKLPATTWELWLDAAPPKTQVSWLKSNATELQ